MSGRPIDITFVTSLRYSDSGAAQSRHLAYYRGLAELGVTVRVLLLTQDSLAGTEELADASVEFRPLGRTRGSAVARTLELAGAIQRAAREIRKSGSAAIVLLDTHPVILLPLIRAARRSGIPVLHERTEHPAVVAPSGYEGRAILGAYYRYCLPQFSGIYAITKPLLMFLLEQAGPGTRGTVVNMIVDTTRFLPTAMDQPRNTGEIVHAGSLLAHKDGIDTLVMALPHVRKMPGTAEAYLSVYGPPTGRAELERLLAGLGLPGDAVRLMGQVPSTDIPAILARADALALARPDSMQARYGFPTKLGEYLASGTPTACTSVGQLPRFLTDRKVAYLASPGDVESLAAALHSALTDPNRWGVASEARHLTESTFSTERAAQQIMELVSKCQEG